MAGSQQSAEAEMTSRTKSASTARRGTGDKWERISERGEEDEWDRGSIAGSSEVSDLSGLGDLRLEDWQVIGSADDQQAGAWDSLRELTM